MNVADRIYELRKERGYSQQELANMLGVTRQAVSKWESEQSLPDVDKITELCTIFDVSADYILNGEEPYSKKYDIKRILFWFGTFFNMVALAIMLFDMFLTWEMEPHFMDTNNIIVKVVIVILMIGGTTLFVLSEKKIKYKTIRKFLLINTFAYAGLIAMISYLIGVPGVFWAIVIYLLTLFIGEFLLLKFR